MKSSAPWPEFDGTVDQSDIEALEQIEAEMLAAGTQDASGYASPLMLRLGTKRLTVEMLSEEIPKVRAGEEAAEDLARGIRGVRKQRTAQDVVEEGERAKERLFGAALPLIKTVASREWRRRQQWGSQVTLEDLTQEAIVGFFKGLSGFKPEAMRRSATNYLGQWMLVEMRRSAEVMDHDLQVGHDAGERFRRVRALRSRLVSELGREPTDEEISAASRDPNYVTRPGMVGRAPKKGEAPATGKGLTVEQVAEERLSRSRLGHMARLISETNDDESKPGTYDQERVASKTADNTDLLGADPAELAADAASTRAIAVIVEQTIIRMRLPDQQREVIARRFGLHPYEEEASAREISRFMGVHRERVTKILTAFNQEMTRQGGVFHEVVASVPEEDLLALGLGWVMDTLGPWNPKKASKARIPSILVDPNLSDGRVSASPVEGSTKAAGVLAWYLCDYHDQVFSCLYPDLRTVPRQRVCPACKKPSSLQRTSVNHSG